MLLFIFSISFFILFYDCLILFLYEIKTELTTEPKNKKKQNIAQNIHDLAVILSIHENEFTFYAAHQYSVFPPLRT